jgi:hypothetical protein
VFSVKCSESALKAEHCSASMFFNNLEEAQHNVFNTLVNSQLGNVEYGL